MSADREARNPLTLDAMSRVGGAGGLGGMGRERGVRGLGRVGRVGGVGGMGGMGGAILRGDRRSPTRTVGLGVWLVFLVFPIVNAIDQHGPALGHGLAIAAAATFVVSFVALVVLVRRRPASAWIPMLFVIVVLIAVALTLFDRPGWGFLFTYCAAGTAMLTPARFTLLGVGACGVLAGASTALGGGGTGNALGFVASTAGIGLLMLLMRDLRVRNEELCEARAELARLAVAEERERFARDLHDLLGHTLSVVALKAELAGRLVRVRPEDAEREIAEVEAVARGALGDVREAVSGYRQPTLEGELAGARMALSAAGIHSDLRPAQVKLEPPVEAVLAWTVREGATNVIRHSGASLCTVRVAADLTEASVEVIDNGHGRRAANGVISRNGRPGSANGASPDAKGAPANAGGTPPEADGGGMWRRGHGLAGLAERAELLHGRVEAGSRPEGGFRLAVSVPVAPR